MIPKIIHYCWYGGEEMPNSHCEYIDGWKNLMPDFEVKRWDESNSPFHSSYIRQAYKYRKWSNMSNYIRLYSLYYEGGIYLDTDVEVIKGFDSLLNLNCFLGFESQKTDSQLRVNTAILGACKGNQFVRNCLKLLVNFFDGKEPSNYSSPYLLTLVLKSMGLTEYGIQSVGGVDIFPSNFFYPYQWNDNVSNAKIDQDTMAIHHWNHSWKEKPNTNFSDKINFIELNVRLFILKKYLHWKSCQ